jgi:predicted Zn-dependent peptidase
MIRKVVTRLLLALVVTTGLMPAQAGAADVQDVAVEPRRSAGAAKIGLMIFPPLLWDPPAVGIDVEREVLSNGIVLYLYPDRMLPLLDVIGLFRGGRLYEPPERAGLARIAASQIRAGGTASTTADALNEELDTLAASLEMSAGDEALEIRLNLLSRHTERGLELLADVLLKPTFDAGQLELARGRLLEELRRRRDDPRELLYKEFAALHYTDRHPLGAEATAASLTAIKRDDLVAFHRRFIRPDNLILGVAGDFDKETLVAHLERVLGAWSVSDRLSLPAIPPVKPAAKPGVAIIDKPVPQSAIALGHFGVDRTNPDREAIELMNLLLGGGGLISRLGKRVRSFEGLAYSVGSRFGTDGREPGLFQVIGSTRTEAAPQAISAMIEEITRLREAPVTAAELDTAKEAVANSFLFRFTDPADTIRQLMLLEFMGLPRDYYQTLLSRYRAITPERLQQVARRYLRPDDLAIVVVGDSQPLERALARFGPVKTLSGAEPPAAGVPSVAPHGAAPTLPRP